MKRVTTVRFRRLTASTTWFLALVCLLMTAGVLIRNARSSRKIDELSEAFSRYARMPVGSDASRASLERGRAAIAQNRWDEGQIYLVNAATNAPRDLAILGACVDAVEGRKDAPAEALDRVASVLSVIAYQVDAADVPKVLGLVERCKKAVAEREQGPTIDPSAVARELAEKLDGLRKVDGNVLWKSPEVLADHLDKLRDLIEAVEQAGPSAADSLVQAKAEFDRWSRTSDVARQAAYVDACLGKLDAKGADLATDRAVSIVQAAENALPAFWGVDHKALPSTLRDRVDAYPSRVKDLVERIAGARSAPVLAKITAILDKKATGKTCEEDCKIYEKNLNEAGQLALGLKSAKELKAFQDLVKKVAKLRDECRQKQYDSYQNWVVNKCGYLFGDYYSYTIPAKISSNTARELFRKYEIHKVDQVLLSPEVARLFQDVYGKLAERMDVPELVKTETEMATGKTEPANGEKKKRLEDF